MKTIYVIGGANLDIIARSFNEIIPADSNPGTVSYSIGGVSHNIASNLSLMGCDVQFVTAFSRDDFGKQIRQHCLDIGLKLDHAQYFDQYASSLYIAIVQPDGDMNVAVSDMNILSHLDVEELKILLSTLTEDDLVVIDTNLTVDQIGEMVNSCRAKICVDPISTTKAHKIIPYLNRLYFFKPNRIEAEHILNHPCRNIEDYLYCVRMFVNAGVKNIVISLGSEGLIGSDGEKIIHMSSVKIDVANTTGAGDGFMAGFVYGSAHNRSFSDCLKYAVAAGCIALSSNETVNPLMSDGLLEKYYLKVSDEAEVKEYEI